MRWLIAIIGLTLPSVGCGQMQVAQALDAQALNAQDQKQEAAPVGGQARQPRPENRQAKTPLMRALLDAVDMVANVKDEERDNLRGMLLEHDDTLHQAIGGSAKDAVLRAQRRHPRLVPGAWPRPEPPTPGRTREELPAPSDGPATGPSE